MTSNGVVHYEAQPLPAGIYSPIPTPFHASEDLDLDALVQHSTRLAKAGVGLVIAGSTGEAIQLTAQERFAIVSTVRKSFMKEGIQCPIIAGTGSGSLRETIELSKNAQKAGADAVIVIAPGYFSSAIAKDRKALKEFFWETAANSPLPVMVYNFPAAASGIDLDSDLLEEIAAHPNIVGAKLTCAGVGKGGRLANSPQVKGRTPFHVFPGFADILFPGMMVGMTGAIAGTANLLPRLTVHFYKIIVAYQQSPSSQTLADVQKLSDILSRADWALSKVGITGSKWVLERWYDSVGPPRKPLQPLADAQKQSLEHDLTLPLEMERELERKAGVTVAKP